MTEQRVEQTKMLIGFYNMQAGASIRTNNERNQRIVDRCLEISNSDIVSIKNHIREYVKSVPKDEYSFDDCFDSFKVEKPVVEVPQATTDAGVQYSMGMLEQAVVGLIAQMNATKIEEAVMGSVEDKVKAFIKEEYGTIDRKVNVVIGDKKVEMQGVVHDKFDTVLKFVSNDEPVFLTGPAGSGKNYLCKQVADALGLDFYFTNAVTQEYKLTGFTDAMGNYQETQFYKAFKNGGLFMLDEMDASIPEVLIILNAAIANRYFDFPAPIGYVEAHPNFRVIAAGNTYGNGADIEYVGRNQLDGASLDRFALVEIDYSMSIENNMALGDIELANFCRDYRKSAKKGGLQVIVSYRAISRLAKMMQIMDLQEALDTCLVKGLDKDDINVILNGLSREDKYKTALQKVMRARE